MQYAGTVTASQGPEGAAVPQGGIELEVKPKKSDESDLILDELENI